MNTQLLLCFQNTCLECFAFCNSSLLLLLVLLFTSSATYTQLLEDAPTSLAEGRAILDLAASGSLGGGGVVKGGKTTAETI